MRWTCPRETRWRHVRSTNAVAGQLGSGTHLPLCGCGPGRGAVEGEEFKAVQWWPVPGEFAWRRRSLDWTASATQQRATLHLCLYARTNFAWPLRTIFTWLVRTIVRPLVCCKPWFSAARVVAWFGCERWSVAVGGFAFTQPVERTAEPVICAVSAAFLRSPASAAVGAFFRSGESAECADPKRPATPGRSNPLGVASVVRAGATA